MTKEKTALVIPNAIQICTRNEKLFFCSFTVRDKAHVTLFKVNKHTNIFTIIGFKQELLIYICPWKIK